MPTATSSLTVSVGGLTFSSRVQRTSEGQIGQGDVAVPAGIAGAITGAGGVDGLATGHGFTNGNVVAVHWTASSVRKCRYDMVIDVASTNAVTFTVAGYGDSLPAEDTAVVLSLQKDVECSFDPDLALLWAIVTDENTHIRFYAAGAGGDPTLHLVADEAVEWNSQGGYTNPLGSTSITKINVSNASTTAAVLNFGVLYDSLS